MRGVLKLIIGIMSAYFLCEYHLWVRL